MMQKDSMPFKSLTTTAFWRDNVIYVLFVLYFIVFSFISPRFLTVSNLTSVFRTSCVTMLLTVGMMYTLIAGHIDLSIGMIMFTSASAACCLGRMGAPAVVLVLGSLCTGLLCGLINGLFVSLLDTYAMLPTIATQFLFRGIGLTLLGSRTGNMPGYWSVISTFSIGTIPVFIFAAFALAIGAQLVLTKTKIGRRVFALGDSQKTASEKGVSIVKTKVFVFMFAGLFAALAGLVSSSQTMDTSTTMGLTSHTYAILAAMLGGASFHGARGSAFPGAFVGALLISLMSNALGLLKANPYLYQIVYAFVILAVYVIDTAKHKEDH